MLGRPAVPRRGPSAPPVSPSLAADQPADLGLQFAGTDNLRLAEKQRRLLRKLLPSFDQARYRLGEVF